MSGNERVRGVLDFLRWVAESRATDDMKGHVKILGLSYIAGLHDRGLLAAGVVADGQAEAEENYKRQMAEDLDELHGLLEEVF